MLIPASINIHFFGFLFYSLLNIYSKTGSFSFFVNIFYIRFCSKSATCVQFTYIFIYYEYIFKLFANLATIKMKCLNVIEFRSTEPELACLISSIDA